MYGISQINVSYEHGFEVCDSVKYHHEWVIPEVLCMLAVLCSASYD